MATGRVAPQCAPRIVEPGLDIWGDTRGANATKLLTELNYRIARQSVHRRIHDLLLAGLVMLISSMILPCCVSPMARSL